jgi:hypothetical protein
VPTDTSLVGGQLLPIPTGGQDSDLVDHGVSGILSYLAHYLRSDLNTKLAEMRGPATVAPITDVAPASRLFPFDHEGTWARVVGSGPTPKPPALAQPAMWAWATASRPNKAHSTLVFDAIERTVFVEWIFPELQVPDGMGNRAGLQQAVAAVFHKAYSRNRHDTWAYNGQAAGLEVHVALGLMGWSIVECTAGRLQPKPRPVQRAGEDGFVKRFHPCVKARLELIERVQGRSAVIPDDVLQDATFDFAINDGNDSVVIHSGVADGLDGS